MKVKLVKFKKMSTLDKVINKIRSKNKVLYIQYIPSNMINKYFDVGLIVYEKLEV